MRRFVYSPQVNAYVMTEEFGIVDLSPDIISGSVTRRLNAVSSAELTINNRPLVRNNRFEGKYLRTIKPMDRIVIYLTRIHKPTLVFSGYVDDATFDQIAPGPIKITASCTLKRLLHTYFDPGLPYVQKYLAQFGWNYEYWSGKIQHQDQITLQNLDISGGAGELLRATLHDIGGWPIGAQGEKANTVHIYKLPQSFIDKTTDVFRKQVPAIEQRRAEIERFLKTLLTYDGSFGDPDMSDIEDFAFESQYEDSNPLPRSIAGEYNAQIYGPSYSLAGFAAALKIEAKKEGFELDAKQLQNAQEIFNLVKGNAYGYGNWSVKAACGWIGTAWGESSLDNEAVNTSSGATGLFQLLSGGFFGSEGHIADAMRDTGVANPGAPALRGPEAKNPTYNTLAILRDSIGQSHRSEIEASDVPSYLIAKWFERPEAAVIASPNTAYAQKGIKMTNAARRAVAASQQASKSEDEVQGEVGDVMVFAGFYSDNDTRREGQTTTGPYTFRIIGNPYKDDKMIFRVAGVDPKLKRDTISIYVPGAKDDSTPQAENWKNKDVVLETSAGKKSRFVRDTVADKVSRAQVDQVVTVQPRRLPEGQGQPSTKPHVVDFARAIANIYGGPLTIWDNSTHSTSTVNGNRSDHADGNAADIPMTGENLTRLGQAALIAAGMPESEARQITSYVGSINGVNILFNTIVGGNHYDHLHIGLKQAVTPAAGAPTSGTGAGSIYGSTGVQITQTDVAQTAASVMFGAALTFPTTGIEAAYLTGERALANDIPLMQWVEFIATSSGRVFQSMPRGDFMAFYPDYFNWAGEAPYWRISDIETIDLNITLSDQEIATHVFTTGDTLYMNDAIDIYEQMASTVASVETIGTFADFVNIGTDPQLFAKQFLNRYGARPMTVERTEIKHSMLQFMYGWMKFLEQWAKQYVCQAQFTFMPELYPGGLVEFTNKDLVMYIEEVTHTFDLTSGFSTTASLTAPSTRSRSGYNHGMVLTQGGMVKNNPKPGINRQRSGVDDD